MIKVENLSKSYGTSRDGVPVLAVENLSFTVEAGEIVGFLGKNGAGKTTTMRMITGFLPPTDGTVTIDGFDVFEQSMDARRRIGYLPETPPLYPEMTVAEYVRFAAELKDVAKDKRDGAVDTVIGRLQLGDMRNRLIRHLSKGYRQRVGLAQALVHQPKVLVLDEPTVGLDPAQIMEIQDLIKGVAHDTTVILSTHILEQVEAICKKTIVIMKGSKVFDGSLEEFRSRAASRKRLHIAIRGPREAIEPALRLAAGAGTVEFVETRDGVSMWNVNTPETATDVRETIFRAVVNGGWVLLEMAPRGGALQEVFLDLTSSPPAADAAGDKKEMAA